MPERITNERLAGVLGYLAKDLGMHIAKSYRDVGGLGINQVSGGVQLVLIANERGGESDLSSVCSKRELYDQMHFALNLIREARKQGGIPL